MLAATVLSPFCAFSENEWNHPKESWNVLSVFRINKEDPRAFFVPHFTLQDASKILDTDGVDKIYDTQSSKLLSGDWKFFFAKTPSDKNPDFFKKDFNDAKWATLEVPCSWQARGYDTISYSNHNLELSFNKDGYWLPGFHKKAGQEMSDVARDPFIPEMHRQSGVYRRKFDIPQNWNGKEVFVRFNGVRTGFNLYINGKHVGYSEDSFTPAEFNITKYLEKGENTIAAEVFKFTTGAYFEMQDMPHMMGIIRDVVLLARPKLYVRDYYAPQKLSDDLKSAEVNFEVDLKNLSDKSADNAIIKAFLIDNADSAKRELFSKKIGAVKSNAEVKVSEKLSIKDFKLWSPDKPNLYTLVFELTDANGNTLEAISADYAFRKFEIRGKTLFLNNQRFFVKGTNRHDWSPDKGKAADFHWLKKDAELMAQANINAVRTSHYPNDDKFLMLCNRFGLTVMDENNLETHGLREEIPTNHEWFIAPAIDRMRNMVMRDRNVPCVIIWSLGNENGLFFNKSHQAMFDFARKADHSRPIHSEPEMRDPATLKNERLASPTDFVSGMYGGMGRIHWYQTKMRNETRPFLFCEYMHSMGNSTGNLLEIWNEFRKDPSLNGGYLWDWVDQALYLPQLKNPKEKFLADGRDYGTKPTAGSFSSNGIIFADRTYSPKYDEVKRVHQNLQFATVGDDISKLKIKNEFHATNANEFDLLLKIQKNGKTISEKKLAPVDIPAGQEREIKIDLPKLPQTGSPAGDEYFYSLSFVAKENSHFANKNEAVSAHQQFIGKTKSAPIKSGADTATKISQSGNNVIVRTSKEGATSEYVFDKKSAKLVSLKINGKNVITQPLEFDISQAWIENLKAPMKDSAAYELENLLESGAILKVMEGNPKKIICQKDFSNADGDGFRFIAEYAFWNGSAHISATAIKLNETPEKLNLPRVGVRMGVNRSLENVEFYGRGPTGNYNDRKTFADVGVYSDKVKNFLEQYPKLQDSGNREDVRWMAFTDNSGFGALFIASGTPLPFAVLPNTQAEMKTLMHPYELSSDSDTEMRIAWKVSGLGNGSHGPETFDEYRPHFKGAVNWSFWISPLNKGMQAADTTLVKLPDVANTTDIPSANLTMPELKQAAKGKWISNGATTEYSSIDEKWSPKIDTLTTTAEGKFSFHTKEENKPWAVVDLGKSFDISEIEILNRDDGNGYRTAPIAVYVSNDNVKWTRVWSSDNAKKRWLVRLKSPTSARYVKLQLEKRGVLHLKGIKVFSPQ